MNMWAPLCFSGPADASEDEILEIGLRVRDCPPLATRRHETDTSFVKAVKNRDSDQYPLKFGEFSSETMCETVTPEVR
jgi:hypothetical protein